MPRLSPVPSDTVTPFFAAEASRYGKRRPDLTAPEELANRIVRSVEVLANRGFALDDIAEVVETRTRTPDAVMALGVALSLVAAERAITRGAVVKVSRRKPVSCADTNAVIERIAERCDTLWSR